MWLPTLPIDDWNFAVSALSLIIGTAVGVAGIVTGVMIARKSGQLKASRIRLAFAAAPMPANDVMRVVYALPREPQDALYLAALPLEIVNTGDRAADEVDLQVSIPAGASQELERFVSFDLTRGFDGDVDSKYVRVGELLHSHHRIKSIKPRVRVEVEVPFRAFPTADCVVTTPVLTKDGVNATVSLKFDVSLRFDISVRTREDLPVSSTIELKCWGAEDRRALLMQLRARNREDGDDAVILVAPAFRQIATSDAGVPGFLEEVTKTERFLLRRPPRLLGSLVPDRLQRLPSLSGEGSGR